MLRGKHFGKQSLLSLGLSTTSKDNAGHEQAEGARPPSRDFSSIMDEDVPLSASLPSMAPQVASAAYFAGFMLKGNKDELSRFFELPQAEVWPG